MLKLDFDNQNIKTNFHSFININQNDRSTCPLPAVVRSEISDKRGSEGWILLKEWFIIYEVKKSCKTLKL
jgi:hypothetical protein